MTYEECAAAGMTQAETARAMGRSKAAVSVAAKRLGLTFAGRSPSQEAIEKMRAARIGKKPSQEAIEKIRAARIGKKHSPEAIEKMRAARIGKKHSPETIEKMRAARIGKKPSQEAIEKIRAAKLGPLTALTEAELDDYRLLRRTGYRRADALAAMGRMDLIGGDA